MPLLLSFHVRFQLSPEIVQARGRNTSEFYFKSSQHSWSVVLGLPASRNPAGRTEVESVGFLLFLDWDERCHIVVAFVSLLDVSLEMGDEQRMTLVMRVLR